MSAAAEYVAAKVAEGVDFGRPLLGKEQLGEESLQSLAEISQELRQEYSLRKQMLLERVAVVVQSFAHSRSMREGGSEVLAEGSVAKGIAALQGADEPSFSVYNVMCARSDLADSVLASGEWDTMPCCACCVVRIVASRMCCPVVRGAHCRFADVLPSCRCS